MIGVLVRSKTGQFCFLGPEGEPVELVDGDRLDVADSPGGTWMEGIVEISEGRSRLQPADIPLDFVAANALKVRKGGGVNEAE